MQPQFNDEVSVPVVVPGAPVLLPLPDLELELLLYVDHGTRKRPKRPATRTSSLRSSWYCRKRPKQVRMTI
jgi:hypothetical protein